MESLEGKLLHRQLASKLMDGTEFEEIESFMRELTESINPKFLRRNDEQQCGTTTLPI